jgi:hypothetical protein
MREVILFFFLLLHSLNPEILKGMVQPSICKCCGGPLPVLDASHDRNLTICDSCFRMVDDVQDSTVIESAIPYETDQAATGNAEEHKEKSTVSRSDSSTEGAQGD